MPGLLGIFHKNSEFVDISLFQKMISLVSHHPWYKKDLFISRDSRCAVAAISLPIIDHGSQPHLSTNRKIKVFLHGEIYHDDINLPNQLEYICHLYEKFDIKFVNYLNGSFIIFIIDELQGRVVITNDRTASRPLFYFFDNQTLYCAPELKGLLPIDAISRDLNTAAIASFLSCGYLLNGETWVSSIKTLDNATILVLSNEGHYFLKYWEYLFDEDTEDRGMRYYQDILSDLIRKAVRARIRSSHKYGVLLSGGYDSRGILGCVLQEKHPTDIKTISWGRKEDIPYSDCLIAKNLAYKLDIPHIFYALEADEMPKYIKNFVYLSDGMTDACTNYPTSLKIFEGIRDELDIDILLRGDECFGWISSAFDEKTMFSTLGINPIGEIVAYQEILKDGKLRDIDISLEFLLNNISNKTDLKSIHNRKDFFYLDQRLKNYLNYLNHVKRMEIEIRNPFIDNDILDFLKEVPYRYRIGKKLYIRAIKELFPRLFRNMAYQSNDINWGKQIRESEVLGNFLEGELFRDDSIIHELYDDRKFRCFMMRRGGSNGEIDLKSYAMKTFGQWPGVYTVLNRAYTQFKKRAGIQKPAIEKEIVVRRLLTLKIWRDLFLM